MRNSAILAFCLLARPVLAQVQEPNQALEIRGHYLGDERWTKKNCEMWKEQSMLMCHDPNEHVGSLGVLVNYFFSNDRLAMVSLNFESRDYEGLTNAFIAKLGQPDSTWSEEWQNRMGASFQ